MTSFLVYLVRVTRCALQGSRLYYAWMLWLVAGLIAGLWSWSHHLTHGLAVTNMSDPVSWGIGIANFVYFVGVAAAAALLVVPAYAYRRDDIKEVVLIGELLAVVAVVMCLLFIMSDIGRPERLWHLFPGIGIINLPSSLLSWDVVVFSGYLMMNLYIPGYLLYKKYRGQTPRPLFYLPLVFVSMLWAVSIHTVTAFLLSGLGSRYFWHTAILAPRFLISAGASGPAILILVFSVIKARTPLKVKDSVFDYLKLILRWTMPVNLFMLGCDLFNEFYSGSLHAASAQYLYFGLGTHRVLTTWIWSSMALDILGTAVFLVPRLRNSRWLYAGCVMAIFGIWIEKGMGLIFPGFTPSPLGEVVEYTPNVSELLVCGGVLSLGAIAFTAMVKVAVAIQTGRLRETPQPAAESP